MIKKGHAPGMMVIEMIRDKPKIWIISKTGIEPLEIEASSFDEAIRKAREINKEYNTGQLKEILQ